MRHRRFAALGLALIAVGAISWGVADPGNGPALMLVGALLPAAAALWVWAELGGQAPVRAAIGGTVVGITVALVSHGVVLAFAYAFLLGFAEAATDFLDALSVDPKLTEILGSPWTILLMIEVAVVAPLTEEFGKALGGRWQRPGSRREAFVAGAAAGAGFAVAENVLYASGALWFGVPWTALLLGRSMGAAVHVFGSGLVSMGWWQWRATGESRHMWRGYASGVAVHALWNGSLVVLSVADGAYQLTESTLGFPALSLAYSAVIGAVTAAGLWMTTRALRDDDRGRVGLRLAEASGIGGWIVVAASLLVPVAMLVLTFPRIYG
ncbi:MAG TPA: PrsW family glutamic-type intramembrane protease [Acidimicrobiia bacterium]|nr:PrsW family glutamic-type intramembrane protease [Acidimicrobiia bacterium]